MHRIILAIFICFSFSFIFAGDVLVKFDKEFSKSSKQARTQIHNELKDLYIKSLVNNDIELRIKALNRLIKSSISLNLNPNDYKKDLQELTKDIKPNIKKQPSSTELPYLLSATKGNNELILKFNQDINHDQIKIFSLNNNKHFRNIIDISGIINGKKLIYKNFLTDEIVIAQNNKTTIRIVLRDKRQKNAYIKIDKNILLVSTKEFVSNENVQKTTSSKAVPQKQKTTNQKAVAIASKTVVIDPGHGGSDPGAINGKYQEKNAVLAVSKRLGEYLKKRGYKVYYTRDNDVFINLRTRTKMANDKSADLFVSIHANAAPNAQRAAVMRGIETFFLSPAKSERSKNAAALENKSDIDEMNFFSKETFLNFLNREKIIASNKLGIDMQAQILKSIRAKRYKVVDGGVREAPFWVLVGALMPAVLIEIGYITHPEEGKLLFDERYQEALANGIANGIDEYFIKNR